MYDTDLIYSWRPREFKLFLTGAQMRTVDLHEEMARQAMMYRYASNAKRAKEKDMFDAEKARSLVMSGKAETKKYDLTRFRKAKEAMKNWKGGMSRGS